ncbi:MAG: prepilin-type N-terminal cleavage/methylation domain-containing protein [Gammaproteobacteria bacterium]|nr:prepilin-type N-terminal cleavage/methylation domain-containing protein [Gammaproteobacteria bacterium]
MKRTLTKGFTLIEVMVTLVILAILVSIMWNFFDDYLRKNTRGQAVHALSLLRQEMQRCASNNNGNFTGCNNTYTTFVQPIMNRQYPNFSYIVTTTVDTVNGVVGAGYTLRATNTGNDPDCLTLEIDELGNKTFTGTSTNTIRCWGSN